MGPGVHEPRAEAFLPLTTCFLTWEQNRTLSSAGATDSTAEAAGSWVPQGGLFSAQPAPPGRGAIW